MLDALNVQNVTLVHARAEDGARRTEHRECYDVAVARAVAPLPVLALVGCGLCGLSVGILWPGVFSLAAEYCPQGGTAMFALLALAGDVGCSSGPSLVGAVAQGFHGQLKAGLLAAIVFPVVLSVGVRFLKRK